MIWDKMDYINGCMVISNLVISLVPYLIGMIHPIDVNLHLQNSLEIFDKNSAAKNPIQKGHGVESALPHAN